MGERGTGGPAAGISCECGKSGGGGGSEGKEGWEFDWPVHRGVADEAAKNDTVPAEFIWG